MQPFSRSYSPSTHRHFFELASLLVNYVSFDTTVMILTDPEHRIPAITVDSARKMVLPGTRANAHVFPHRLIHGVAHDRWPDSIEVHYLIAEALDSQSNSVELGNGALVDMIVRLAGGAFLTTYEREVPRYKHLVRNIHPSKWAETWRFAWLLRNAIAHGNRWKIDDPTFPRTVWNEIEVSPNHSGLSWFSIGRFLGVGDILLLMEEIST